jgi:hypothetical protein
MYNNAWTGTPRDKDSPDAHYNLQSAGFEVCSVCNDVFRVQGASVNVNSKAYKKIYYNREMDEKEKELIRMDQTIIANKNNPTILHRARCARDFLLLEHKKLLRRVEKMDGPQPLRDKVQAARRL